MKNLVLDQTAADFINLAPAAAVSSGGVVVSNGFFGVAQTDLAAGIVGPLLIRGRVTLTKPTGTGTDYAVGTLLGWDATNSRATTDISAGAIVRVTAVPATAATVVEGDLNPAVGVRSSDFITATNGSGATWTAGVPVRVGGQWAVPLFDIANNASGTLRVAGRVTIAKTAGFAVTVGQALGLSAGAAVADLSAGAVIRATAAAASGDTVVTGDLNPTPRAYSRNSAATSGEQTANQVVLDLGFTPAWWQADVVVTATQAAAAGNTAAISGTTITLGATDIVNTHSIRIRAVEW